MSALRSRIAVDISALHTNAYQEMMKNSYERIVASLEKQLPIAQATTERLNRVYDEVTEQANQTPILKIIMAVQCWKRNIGRWRLQGLEQTLAQDRSSFEASAKEFYSMSAAFRKANDDLSANGGSLDTNQHLSSLRSLSEHAAHLSGNFAHTLQRRVEAIDRLYTAFYPRTADRD